MKEGIWGWWMIVLGLMVIGVIMLVTDMTTSSEQNYYMTKQIVKASMEEAIDYEYYANNNGQLRISSEKFMENFIRRYAEIITINKTTKINFYDIYEMPPKVTVEISTTSSRLIYGNDSKMLVPVVNKISAILETTE